MNFMADKASFMSVIAGCKADDTGLIVDDASFRPNEAGLWGKFQIFTLTHYCVINYDRVQQPQA